MNSTTLQSASAANASRLPAGMVACLYGAIAAAWVFGSDWFVGMIVEDVHTATLVGTLKGWLFIAVTAALLYAALRKRTAGETATGFFSIDMPAGAKPRSPLAPVILTMAVIVTITATSIYFRFTEIERREASRIELIAQSRANEVGAWLRQHMAEMEFIRSNPDIAALYLRWRDHGDRASLSHLIDSLSAFRQANEYQSVRILDERWNTIARDNGEIARTPSPVVQAAAQHAAETGKALHTDVYYRGDSDAPLRIDFIAPLIRTGTPARGTVVLRVDPGAYLLPMVKRWPADALRGQITLISRRGDRVSIMSELSAVTGPPSVQRSLVRAIGATADKGSGGHPVSTTDYRGIAVLAVARAIPETDWLVVAKVERAAIIAESLKDATWILLGGVLAALATFAMGAYYRERAARRIAAVRQEEQSAQLQSLQLLKAIAESSTDIIYAYDREGRYIFFNRQASRVAGKAAHEVVGHDDTAIFSKAQAEVIKREHEMVIAERKAMTFEKRLSTVDGERCFMSTKGPLLDNNGNIIGSYGISRDVTALKRATEEAKTLATHLAAIQDSIPSPLAVIDHSGVITSVNRAWRQFALDNTQTPGAPATNTDIGTNYLEICRAAKGDCAEFSDDAHVGIRAVLDRRLSDFTLEYPCHSRTEERWFVMTVTPLVHDHGGAVVVHHDISSVKNAELALKQSEGRLALFVAYAPAAIAMFDRDMRYIATSNRWKTDYRLGERELIGVSHYEIFPEITERWKDIHRRCLAGAVESSAAEPFARGDGSLDWLSWEVRPWFDNNGTVGGIMIASEVITDRKRAQDESAYFSQLVAQANDAIIGRSEDRRIVSWNRAAERMFGYAAREAIGMDFARLVPADKESESARAREQVVREGSINDLETERLAKDGRRVEVAVSAASILDADGHPIGVGVVCRDNSERKRAQRLQRMQTELLEMIATDSPLADSLMTLATRVEELADDVLCSILLSDDKATRLANGASPSLPADYVNAINGIEIGPNIGSCGASAFLRRPVITEDIFSDPAWHDFAPLADAAGLRACWSTPLLDAHNEVAGTLALYRRTPGAPSPWHHQLIDVATYIASICISNARARRALQQSESRYRSLFASLHEGVIVYDRNLQPIACNPSAERLLHVPMSEFNRRWDPGSRLPAVIDDQGRPVTPENHLVARMFRSGESIRDVVRGQPQEDGSILWVSYNVEPLHDAATGETAAAIVTFTDITERFKHELEMRKLLAAIEQSLNSIVITDLEGRIEFVNDAFTRITSWTRDEVIGRNPRILRSGKTPAATYTSMWTALLRGEAWRGEFINRRKSGDEYVESVYITPIRDGTSRISHYIAVREDVTERKRIGEELDRYRHHLEELVQTRTHALEQANAALNLEVGQRATAEAKAHELNVTLQARQHSLERALQNLESFSYSVSHDLRAPLRAVAGYAGMLADNHAALLPEDGRRMLDRIVASAKKMDQLIIDILQYSRVERIQRKDTQVDTAAIAGAIAQEMAASYPHASIVLGDLPVITADETMVRQVFANLIANACKFSSKRDDARIEIGSTTENGVPEFYVRDNGAGFDMNYADKLFTLFRRMHSEQEFPGTGVGLAIVKRLIEHHEGHITAESKPGVSTVFRFTLASGPRTAPGRA